MVGHTDMGKPIPPRATTSLKVLFPDGRIIETELAYYPQYRSFFRAGGCCIELNIETIGRYFYKSTDYFHALAKIRTKLEAKGIRLLCWGAGKNAWPSGMQRDMGAGLEVYELLPEGNQGPQHSIFEYAPTEMTGTFAEQKSYAAQWFQNKLGNKTPK